MTSLKTSSAIRFEERVYPSVGAFGASLMVWPTIWLALAPLNSTLGAVLGLVLNLGVVALMYFGAPKVVVTDDDISVGKARIQLSLVAEPKKITKDERRAEIGPKLNARAYLQLQATVKEMVRVQVLDDSDPTPYWIFSTRNADEICRLIKG
ncbi:DUF3093 domain-containing protein [Rhodoluna sp. KAS3]|uniref:DUF3093 domain-containing protein n=1 Tax=Rhodoluna sp. KAS3 TaxID=942880 RepID=UPI002231F6B3|nr:DUF3093 domain-containing protein [Rhodoluna sp. KAS3]BDS49085.1 hypothetical protein RKAS3_06620 [Rhodoluna sp. KAS3]